jgi:hypothetical protein
MSIIIKRQPETSEEPFEQWKERREANADTIVYNATGANTQKLGEAKANAHFAKCFAERKALIASGRALDDDINIDDYCHFDCEGYAEPCHEYGRLIGMGATND